MSKDKDTGGPAFPIADKSGWDGKAIHVGGMTLRDYFAGQALTGLLAADARYSGRTDDRTSLAMDAYATADFMLAARKTDGEI